MSRIKCDRITEGALPTEKVVRFKTADGIQEEVVVYEGQARGDTLDVAALQQEGDRVLIELPRESASGSWRLWVARDSVIE